MLENENDSHQIYVRIDYTINDVLNASDLLISDYSSLIVEYTDWKINTITDEDVAKPDLVGYTIIE